MRSDVLENNPEAVRAMLLAWQDAMEFMASNPLEAKEIIARNVGSSLDELEPAMAGVKFYDLAENKAALKGEFRDVVREVAQVMLSNGWIKAIPDPDTLPECWLPALMLKPDTIDLRGRTQSAKVDRLVDEIKRIMDERTSTRRASLPSGSGGRVSDNSGVTQRWHPPIQSGRRIPSTSPPSFTA